MSTAQPPSPSFVSPSGLPSGGGLLEELEGQEHKRNQEGEQVNLDPDISIGFKPKLIPPMTPQVDMSLSGVPLDDLNISGLSSSPMTILKQPPKCLNDTYEGLISPIRGDYGIINNNTFHPANNENKSNQSRLGALEDNEGEGNLSAANPPWQWGCIEEFSGTLEWRTA
jgi:hypothetical protein